LIGGIVGLLGAVAALWWRYKLGVALGTVTGLRKDVESLTKDLAGANTTLDTERTRLAALVVEHQAALARDTAVLLVHTTREEALRALLQKCNDPAVLADRLGQLFPVLPKTP
jgi:hypothetical protein